MEDLVVVLVVVEGKEVRRRLAKTSLGEQREKAGKVF